MNDFYEKRDCLSWQPLTLISKETIEYIENTKNEKTRRERFAAYTLLFFVVESFFKIKIKKIERSDLGKPHIVCEDTTKKIFISISHSDGVCAVSVSDEGECGVDVQALPKEDIVQRVEKRFLDSFEAEDCRNFMMRDDSDGFSASFGGKENGDTNEAVSSIYLFFAEPRDYGFTFLPNSFVESEHICFLKKWTVCEALLKLSGGGFKDIISLNDIKEKSVCSFTSFTLEGKTYGIASCVLKPNNVNNTLQKSDIFK